MVSRTVDLDLAHVSMQFSDTREQVLADAAKIFDSGYDWITGTEAGNNPVKNVVRVSAWNAGYTFHSYKSNFICVRRDLFVAGSRRIGGVTAVQSSQVDGKQHDLNVCWDSFYVEYVGKVTVLASHYATKGAPVRDPKRRVNLDDNRKLAGVIGDLGDKFGRGQSLVFYGGDQNIVDRDCDTFFGEGFTSAWDELKKYENTGHGNIDVIASYNKDGRVKAKYIRALNDREQFMHTDHFPVEAGFSVRKLRRR